MHKEILQDLLLFHSSSEKKLVTLKEYVGRMKEEQKYIYYACGETVDKIDLLPQTEALKDKGYEILYLTDNVDEFALRMMMKYEEKEFRSVSADNLDLETEEEKQEAAKKVEENKDLLAFMKDALDGKVKEVILSQKLKSHPVCLSSEGAISIEMEKVLNAMPNDQMCIRDRHITVLDYNPEWPLKYEQEKEKISAILKGNCITIYHIGSTSVPGLAAKPIIDIMAVVRSLCLLYTSGNESPFPMASVQFFLNAHHAPHLPDEYTLCVPSALKCW